MILFLISIFIIVLLTVYVIYYTYKQRSHLSCMAGMMIAMTNSMMSSVAIGTILGVYYNVDLSSPTILAVAYGMLVGYLTGKPISLMAALDGLGAGIMGGMMGAMLGVMLLPNKIDVTVIFILAVFIVMVIVLLKVMDEEIAARTKDKAVLKKPLFVNPTLLLVVLFCIAFSYYGMSFLDTTTEADEFVVPPTSYLGNHQQALIDVQVLGYETLGEPLKAGELAVLNFQAADLLGCSSYIYSDDLGFKASITQGKNNYIEVGPLEAGTYTFACTMNMFFGSITVN